MDACGFSLLSLAVFGRMAQLLNLIECGPRWPNAIMHSKGSFHSKDIDKWFDPLAYRILLIKPCLYRKWVATRHRHLKPWIAEWTLDEMYAGVANVSAEEAWYSNAVDIEWHRLQGIPATGASVDIWKCFDQILKPLLKALKSVSERGNLFC